VDIEALENMPLGDLQETEEDLKHYAEELERLVGDRELVRDQEKELTLKYYDVVALEERVKTVVGDDLLEVEKELESQHEQQKKLKDTLDGQRSNIREREKQLKKKLQLLLTSKRLLAENTDIQQLDLKLLYSNIKLLTALVQKQLGEKLQAKPTKEKKLPSWTRWLIPLGIVGLLIIAAAIIYRADRPESKPVTVNSEVTKNTIDALGRIEPQGEVIKVAPPSFLGDSKVEQILVKEGDEVKANQIIAILDRHAITKAQLESAAKEIEVAKAGEQIVKAGAKSGEIEAQKAAIQRLEAQLSWQIAADNAEIGRLEAQLQTERQAQQAMIQRLQSESSNAEMEFKRYEQLYADGGTSASILDQRKMALQTTNESVKEAKANLSRIVDTLQKQIVQAKAVAQQNVATLNQQIQEARANLDRIAEVRSVDVQKAQAEVDKAIATYKQAQQDLELTYVRAPINAQVIKIHSKSGEVADSSKGIVELGQTNQMMVVAEVYESDIGKIRVGQKATIQSESGAFDRELKGTVSEVGRQISKKDVLSSDPAADVDVRVVEVQILLTPEDSRRVANLTYAKVLVKILSN
jgi:HlyD family secretion protein